MKISELSGAVSKFLGKAEHLDNNPANSTEFCEVINPNLRKCLIELDGNIAGRILRFSTLASYMESYYSLYEHPFDIQHKAVGELYTQFRRNGNIIPGETKSSTGHTALAYEREHLLAIGALIWADEQKSQKEQDIVAIAHKALGESPIKDFIHKANPMSDTNKVQKKPAQRQLFHEVSKAFATIEDLSAFTHYTEEELIKRFGRIPNNLDSVCVLTDNHLKEGVDNSGRSVIIYVSTYKALMEIAAYHNNIPYNPRQVEIIADDLTNRGVRKLLKMCYADFSLGYENVGRILSTSLLSFC